MHSRCDDLSANQRRYSLAIYFGSFGSLFIDNINNLYTVYIDSVTPCGQLYPRRFLERDKMTQMTQSRGIPWAPDLRLLGHLGQQKNNDPNDPKTMATGASLQLKNHDPNDPNDPMAAGRSAAGASMQHAARWPWPPACAGMAAGNTHNAKRGTRRADGKGPSETYGS